MELDLNQQPSDPHPNGSVLGLGSLLSVTGTVHERIEEHFYRFQALTSIAIQHMRQQQVQISLPQTNRNDLKAKAVKRKMEINEEKIESSNGAGEFFNCNICLDFPRDPIVTCCGHLFCWPCFFKLDQVISDVRECPICKGEVAENNIIPIYGGNNTSYKSDAEDSGVLIPYRPPARRVDADKKQLRARPRTRRFTSFHIEQALLQADTNTNTIEHVTPPDQTRSPEYSHRSVISSLSSTLLPVLNSPENHRPIPRNFGVINLVNLEEQILGAPQPTPFLDVETPNIFLAREEYNNDVPSTNITNIRNGYIPEFRRRRRLT